MTAATLERRFQPPKRYEAYEADDFVVFEDVPVFDAHTGRDGTVYDRELLQKMCDNMNDRIEDTGDYCPLINGHTPTEEEKLAGVPEPDILGFAGPFKVGTIGRKKPRACILATNRVFRDCEKVYRRNPRRSVEIWGDKPEERIFDPIACLGAETPKRDLGLVYQRDGRRERYEATAPGGSNTFIPGADEKPRNQPDRNQESDAMSTFSPEQINQLVEALVPVLESRLEQKTIAGSGSGEHDKYAALAKCAADGDEDAAGEMFGGMSPDEQKQMRQRYADDADEGRKGLLATLLGGPGEPERNARDRGDLQERCTRLSRENRDLRDKYSRLESRQAELERKERYAARRMELNERQGEGFVFDFNEEFEAVKDLSDAEYTRHMAQVEKYQRVPAGTIPVPKAAPGELAAAQRESNINSRALKIAESEGVPYAAARTKAEAELAA